MSVEITPQTAAVVEITDAGNVVVVETARDIVEVVTVGPQGPQGPAAVAASLGDIPDVDVASAIDNSVLYYDAIEEKWKGNDINTLITLTDGGGF